RQLIAPTSDPDVGYAEYPSSAPWAVIIDTTAPAEPVVTSPADGDAINESAPTFTDSGEDGSRVEIRDEDGTVVCETTVTDGTWSCTPETPLGQGSHQLTPVAIDEVGNEAPGTPVTVIIDTTVP